MRHKIFALIFSLALFFLLSPDAALAEIMKFNPIFQSATPNQIVQGELLFCEDSRCNEPARILPGANSATLKCQDNSCYSLYYTDGDYAYLKLTLNDGQTRTSNIFETATVDPADYDLIVSDDKIEVIDRTHPLRKTRFALFLIFFFITTLLELITGLIYIKKHRWPKTILALIFVLNFIFLALLWFSVYTLPRDFSQSLFYLIIFAFFLLEVFTFQRVFKNHLSIKAALKFCLVINLFGWLIGSFFIGFINALTMHRLTAIVENLLGIS